MTKPSTNDQTITEPPRTFSEYMRSFGPGIVVVLTWLGAGDIVDMGVAGSNYGYSLMWVLVLAVVMRFLFVSLIAKYQLCNQHSEGVLDGLVRLHPWYAPGLLLSAVVMGHVYGSYMTVGVGEACRNVTGLGQVWHWAVLWNGIAVVLIFQPAYSRIENSFKIFLALLSVSFLGTAIWIGPSPEGIVQGLYRMELPDQAGAFNPWLVATAMIGAVGGSLMNLVYPYFLDAKGWRGPQFRRVQLYDFLLAVFVMILLNLAVWTLGAELLHPKGETIEKMDDLPRLLSKILGSNGRILFYLGVFSAVFTSLVGHAMGLGYLGTHALMRWQGAEGRHTQARCREHPMYRWIALWCLISPLIWTIPGMPGFVKLTLVANSAQVVLLPVIAGGLWCITARAPYIGSKYKNRWWENLVMGGLFVLAVWGGYKSIESLLSSL
ncbi:MAG: Nramp family divalent metal transporter [Fuerstiella sp.]|nr:Nramp family divalent metal transporter [Fuerstiella sp.]